MRRITDGVYQVSRGVNAFIVDGDAGVTLIDTGLPGRHGVIESGLGSIGRSLGDVRAILLTHAHDDHTGGVAHLKRASDAPVFASSLDAPAIEGSVPSPLPPILQALPFLGFVSRLIPDAEPVPVDRPLTTGAIAAPAEEFVAVPTPGHTPGHLTYLLNRGGGVAFVGDAAMASRSGIRRGWMNRRTDEFDSSLARLATHQFEIACFGHSAPILEDASGAFQRFADSIR